MTIRPMRPADYPAVDDMMAQLHRLHVEGRPDLYVPMQPVYAEAEYLRKLDDPAMICLMAEVDGAPAGLCFVQLRRRTCMRDIPAAYMDDLFVQPAYRHRGIAKALFREAERIARDMGAVRLDLMVWAFNEEALRFYQSLGMRPQRYIYELPLKEE